MQSANVVFYIFYMLTADPTSYTQMTFPFWILLLLKCQAFLNQEAEPSHCKSIYGKLPNCIAIKLFTNSHHKHSCTFIKHRSSQENNPELPLIGQCKAAPYFIVAVGYGSKTWYWFKMHRGVKRKEIQYVTSYLKIIYTFIFTICLKSENRSLKLEVMNPVSQ